MEINDIKKAVGEALDEKLGEFFIERERHYQDHQFIQNVRNGIDTARKSSIWAFGVAAVGAIIWAIKHWISQIAKGGG